MLGKSIEEIDNLEAGECRLWQCWLTEPRGELRQDYQAASITNAVYTFMQSFGGTSKEISLDDCRLKFTEKKEDDALAKIIALQNMFGGLKTEIGDNMIKKVVQMKESEADPNEVSLDEKLISK